MVNFLILIAFLFINVYPIAIPMGIYIDINFMANWLIFILIALKPTTSIRINLSLLLIFLATSSWFLAVAIIEGCEDIYLIGKSVRILSGFLAASAAVSLCSNDRIKSALLVVSVMLLCNGLIQIAEYFDFYGTTREFVKRLSMIFNAGVFVDSPVRVSGVPLSFVTAGLFANLNGVLSYFLIREYKSRSWEYLYCIPAFMVSIFGMVLSSRTMFYIFLVFFLTRMAFKMKMMMLWYLIPTAIVVAVAYSTIIQFGYTFHIAFEPFANVIKHGKFYSQSASHMFTHDYAVFIPANFRTFVIGDALTPISSGAVTDVGFSQYWHSSGLLGLLLVLLLHVKLLHHYIRNTHDLGEIRYLGFYLFFVIFAASFKSNLMATKSSYELFLFIILLLCRQKFEQKDKIKD